MEIPMKKSHEKNEEYHEITEKETTGRYDETTASGTPACHELTQKKEPSFTVAVPANKSRVNEQPFEVPFLFLL